MKVQLCVSKSEVTICSCALRGVKLVGEKGKVGLVSAARA